MNHIPATISKRIAALITQQGRQYWVDLANQVPENFRTQEFTEYFGRSNSRWQEQEEEICLVVYEVLPNTWKTKAGTATAAAV
jgi:hypothetical protein